MTKFIFILLTATSILMACNNSEKSTTSEKGLIVAASNAAVKYQCPMKCQVDTAYTTAGNCPVCGMELEQLK
jgi:transcription initiation factor IIE alpha subunit